PPRAKRRRGLPPPREQPLPPARETSQCHQHGGLARDFLFVAVVGDDAQADAGGIFDLPATVDQELAGELHVSRRDLDAVSGEPGVHHAAHRKLETGPDLVCAFLGDVVLHASSSIAAGAAAVMSGVASALPSARARAGATPTVPMCQAWHSPRDGRTRLDTPCAELYRLVRIIHA